MNTQLIVKYKNKINWINIDEWSYNSTTFRFDTGTDDNLILNKASSTTTTISNSNLIEKNKYYRIKFKLVPNVDNVLSGSLKFSIGGYTSALYSTESEYSFTTSLTTNTTFSIISTNITDKWAIKDLEISELFHKPLDLYEESLIEINYQIADIQNYDTRTGPYSKQFIIPGSANNNKFFKNIFEINQLQRFNINNKCDAEILHDNYTWLTGYIQLNEILKNEEQIDYKITFYGENLNLFADINEDLIENLYCPELNHTATAGFIRNSWDYPNQLVTTGITYPYISYGTDSTGSNKFKGIVGTATDLLPSLGLIVSDHYPAISVKYLVDKIFSKYGYEYSSEFFNSDYFKQMIIPFCNNEEDLYDWHLATKGTYIGTSFSNFNIGWINSENTFYNNTDGTFKNRSIPYFQSGIITSYNPEGYSDRWIKNETEIYRLFNYGLSFNSYRTHTGYLHPDIIAAGSNSFINIINPNNYQSNTNHLPGSFLCKEDGKYKVRIRFRNISTINATGINLNEGMTVYLCKVDKSNITITGSTNFKCIGEEVTALGYYNIGSLLPNGYVFHYLDENGDETSVVAGNSTITLEREIECNENELLYVKFVPYIVPGTGHNGNYRIWKINPTFIEIYRYGWGEGINLKYNQILPKEIKIKDFLKDLILMFNLYIDIDKDNPKTLIIEPRDDYYASGSTKNWSDKIDIGQEIIYSHPTDYQSYINILKYKDDENYHNKLYSATKDVQKVGYGNKRFLFESDFASGEKTTSLNVFASSPLSNVNLLGDTNKTAAVLTSLWDATYPSSPLTITKKTNHKPRILFFNYINFNDNTSNTIQYNFAGARDNSYPFAGHINAPFNMTGTTTYDLNFDTKLRTGNVYQGTFTSNPNGQMTKNNLWNKFYLKQFKQTTDKNARILTAYFNLDITDVLNLKLNDLIFINNTYFIINKIENFVVDNPGSTRVELLKLDTNVTGDYITIETIADDDPIIVKPVTDLASDVLIGLDNSITSPGNTTLILGNNNVANDSTVIFGDSNIVGGNSVVINGNNNTINEDTTIINSDNVTVENDATNITVINTDDIVITENNVTYIGDNKIKLGLIFNENLILDGGIIEIDGVINPYKCYNGYHINDPGENETDIFSKDAWKIIDGGKI